MTSDNSGGLSPKMPSLDAGQEVLIQFPYSPEKYRTRYVGMVPGDFIIFRLPVIPGGRDKTRAGNSLTVRFVVNGTIYGFHSVILSTAIKPLPMVFLAYPKALELHSLRENRRADTFLTSTVETESGAAAGRILDLSCGGCRVVIDSGRTLAGLGLVSGGFCDVRFSLDDGIEYTAASEVVKAGRYHGREAFTVRFLPGQDDVAEGVGRFVESYFEVLDKDGRPLGR